MKTPDIRRFRKNIRKFERLVSDQLKGDTCCTGVTLAQCHALLEIEEAGRASVGELAAGLGLDKSTLSRTIDGLVNLGLVVREPHPSDRRVTLLSLSPQGQARAEEINRLNDAYFRSVFGCIPEGRHPEVCEGFAALVSAMEKQIRMPFCGPAPGSGSEP
jgi:DNA-binding MarR family transcriptional regulator